MRDFKVRRSVNVLEKSSHAIAAQLAFRDESGFTCLGTTENVGQVVGVEEVRHATRVPLDTDSFGRFPLNRPQLSTTTQLSTTEPQTS